jgi:glycosyltransferase involved in cell wall biosynthesis
MGAGPGAEDPEMRILYVTAGFPYPLTSGYLRHYHFVRELAGRGHAITLLSLVGSDFRPEHAEALAPFTEGVHTFATASRSRSPARKAVRRLRALAAGGADPAVRALGARAARLHAERPFGAVLFSGKRTAPALRSLRGAVPVVADLCDATVSRLRLAQARARPAKAALLALEIRRTRRFERAIIGEAASLVVASGRDLELVRSEHGADLEAAVVPNGVDLGFWRRRDRALPAEPRVVITGAMDYPPNADAALHLAEDVMPLVWRERPDAELLVVGRDPGARLLEAGRAARVTVTGYVDDVRPYLERAAVFAAPLRVAAGIQNKVLEALAMEVPVVASPLAAAGLEVEGVAPPIRCAEQPDAFARELVAALQAARAGAAADAAARRFVAERFAWDAGAERLERLLQAAAGRRRQAVEAA